MKSTQCSTNRLDQLLKGTLAVQDEIDLTQHLEECPGCVDKLERYAADQNRWNDVKLLLSGSYNAEGLLPGFKNDPDQLPLPVRQVIELLDPTDDSCCLGRIGSFEVLGVVGSGAMGVVLKAADRSLDRIVALKVMNPSLAACGTARQRFEREAKATAGVLHPNVIAIHGVSTKHALPYLVMPYVTGTSLQQRLDRQGPLSLPELLRLGSQIAAGLAAAHQAGLIHRDIKPANIMLDSGVETAVITDFGLARTIDDATMTRTGTITGTPEFMSPEQARGDAIDCSSDVFSLGSVLYSLCTGQRPFRAKTSFGVLRKITDATPKSIREFNPDIPVWFCEIIEKMHSKLPAERPSAAKIRDLLERCLAHVYQPDRIPLPDGLARPPRLAKTNVSFSLKIGVILMTTLLIFPLLMMAMFPYDGNNLPDSKESQAQVSKEDDSKVFKTLDLSFPDPEKTGKLIIDINRGFVEVTGHNQAGVTIEILNPLAKEESKKSDTKLRPQFAPKFDLDKDKAANSIKLDTYNQSYALNLRIKVPLKTNLSLDTYYDGYLKVKNVSGKIDTHSQNCDISLIDVSGSATAFSYNGDFKINFRKVAPDAELDFESYNGSIDLTLPANISATTAIATGRGTFLSAFDIVRMSDTIGKVTELPKKVKNADEYQLGVINGGGIPIRIECEKGQVKIRKPEKAAF